MFLRRFVWFDQNDFAFCVNRFEFEDRSELSWNWEKKMLQERFWRWKDLVSKNICEMKFNEKDLLCLWSIESSVKLMMMKSKKEKPYSMWNLFSFLFKILIDEILLYFSKKLIEIDVRWERFWSLVSFKSKTLDHWTCSKLLMKREEKRFA